MKRALTSLLGAAAVGAFGALALGAVNRAAHPGLWSFRAIDAAFGLCAAVLAVRLAWRREDDALSAPAALGFLLLLAVRPEGDLLWSAAPWVAVLGALGALASALAPAGRRALGPSFAVAALFFLLARFSAWNAAVLLGAAALVGLTSLLRAEPARAEATA